jgi:hypothetical protein
MQVPLLRHLFHWRHLRTVLQIPLLIVSVAMILDGLLGPSLAPKNLASLARKKLPQPQKTPKKERLAWVADVYFQSFAPILNIWPVVIRSVRTAQKENGNGGGGAEVALQPRRWKDIGSAHALRACHWQVLRVNDRVCGFIF